MPPCLAHGADYFEAAGLALSIELDEDAAEESAAFLAFLLLVFLVAWPGLVGLLLDDAAEAAAGAEADEAGAAGVWAKAEAANRAATRVAISFFMFNPLRNGKNCNDSYESVRITSRTRIG